MGGDFFFFYDCGFRIEFLSLLTAIERKTRGDEKRGIENYA